MGSSEPRVTILLPSRNAHAGFFREAVGSVLAQSSDRWRLLVIDDATDDPASLDAYAWLAGLGDPRIALVRSRSHSVTGALNTGLSRAVTPYVCVLHSDDLLAPPAIELLERAIEEHPDVDYLYSSRVFIDEDGRPLSDVYEAQAFSDLRVFERTCPVKHLHCFRVAAAQQIGGMDEAFGPHGGDDYDFPWCMAEAGFSFRPIPDCLYRIRDHRAHYRLTTHVPLDVQMAEIRRILRKHGMSRLRARVEVARRKRDYLHQALYASEADREEKERRGFDPQTGWRFRYRQPRRPGSDTLS